MLHEPEMYENPMEFVPERHIATAEKSAEKDPHVMAFGFGRRCAISMLGIVVFLVLTISSGYALGCTLQMRRCSS